VQKGAIFALLLLASLGCSRAPATASRRAPCASLDAPACDRARALVLAASTYADEAHDLILASPSAPFEPGAALARAKDGWQLLPSACARAVAGSPALDVSDVTYAFVGVAVDATLVSADADVGPLLARPSRGSHDVRLVALAFVGDRAPGTFRRGEALVETAGGACTCDEATHFAGATKYGAMLSYAFTSPRDDTHVRALDLVRSALGDARVVVRESRAGAMTIDGLARFLAGDPGIPLTFRITEAAPIAYAAAPIDELCDFPAPEISPSPLDFGVAGYGTEVTRAVHVVNRAAVELRAILGASTYVLPASGSIDLPLRWTPEGDAPECETQTRDETIPFFRVGGATPRTSRVLETIRTGRSSAERTERVVPSPPKLDLASTTRDWTCPRGYVRTTCRADNTNGGDVVAEPQGETACHFACRGAGSAGPAHCQFDAVMACALRCAP
jgi:hypothetical protein